MTIDFESNYTLTIGGRGVAGAGQFPVLNPANEQVVAHAPDCSRTQLDEAVAAARAAFPAWSATPIAKRREALLAIAGTLAANVEPLKRLLTAEQGKPHADAMGDVLGGLLASLIAQQLEPLAATQLAVWLHGAAADELAAAGHGPIGITASDVITQIRVMLNRPLKQPVGD